MREIEAIKVLNMIETHGALSTMAKDKSIEALEKQIPKKPVFNGKNLYMCVNGCEIHKKQFEKVCYCPNCGQKLDWSNKESSESVYLAYEQIRNQLIKIFDISESYEEYKYMVNVVCNLNKCISKDIIYLIAQEVSGFEISM